MKGLFFQGDGMELPFRLGHIFWHGLFAEREVSMKLAWANYAPMKGITNRVLGDGCGLLGFVPFADLDGIDSFIEVEDRLDRADSFMDFGPIYIIRSGYRNFHLIGTKILGADDAVFFSYLVGGGHDLYIFKKQGEMTLRVSAKNGFTPTYVKKWVGERSHRGLHSKGHQTALSAIYGVPQKHLRYVGIPTGLDIKEYETLKW